MHRVPAGKLHFGVSLLGFVENPIAKAPRGVFFWGLRPVIHIVPYTYGQSTPYILRKVLIALHGPRGLAC